MQFRNRIALPMLVLVAGIVIPAAAPSAAGATTVTGLINQVRVSHGLRPLRPVTSLRNSSHAWAAKMIRYDFFAHASRPAVARRFHIFGENIGLTFGRRGSPRRIVRMWLHSPPHRHLIFSPTWRYIGAGSVAGRFRGRRARAWVLRFGR